MNAILYITYFLVGYCYLRNDINFVLERSAIPNNLSVFVNWMIALISITIALLIWPLCVIYDKYKRK